jgi:Chaperone of endosialidase
MATSLNITNIPAPRVPFIDDRTGLMSREWYRFFLNLFILTGSGSNPTTLDELQIGPPNQPDFTELLIQINKDIAPQYEDQSGDFLKTLDTAQLMSMMSRFENAEAAIQGAYLQPVVQTGTIANYNLDSSPTAGGVAYGTGPALAVSAAGTLGQVLTSGGAGAPTWATDGGGTVTSVSVVSANGLAGTVATATTTPAITLSTTITGLLKGNGTAISAAASGTDYAPATSGTSILYGNGLGGFSNVAIGTGVAFAGGTLSATGSGGTVTSVTGTAPVVSSGGATPAISMAAATTSVNGYLTSTDWTTFNSKQPAGSYLVSGGALGTPSSGTVTNLTGTASININGTVGATTPAAGTFTSISDSGNLTFTGTGNRITGDFSNATGTNRAAFQSSTTNGNTVVGLLPNGASTQSQVIVYNNSDPTNANGTQILVNATESRLQATNNGTAGYLPLAIYAGGSERVRITTAGRVGIGTGATVNYALEVSTDSAGKPGVGGLWTVVSDERIKSDIAPANLDRCYEIVKSVPLKYFGFAPGVYNADQIQDNHNLGWIAQDVQKVFKNAVSVKPFTPATGDVIEDCLDLNSGQIIAALYGAVQSLMEKIETLTERVAVLEAK